MVQMLYLAQRLKGLKARKKGRMEERILKRLLLKRKSGFVSSAVLLFCSVHGSSAAFVNGGFHSSCLRRKQSDNGVCRRRSTTSTVKNVAGEAPEAAAVAAVERFIQCSVCKHEEGPKHFGSTP